MAKYISIEANGIADLVFNTKDITLVTVQSETKVDVFAGTTRYILRWYPDAGSQITTAIIVNNINKAILAINGPTTVKVLNTGGYIVLSSIETI